VLTRQRIVFMFSMLLQSGVFTLESASEILTLLPREVSNRIGEDPKINLYNLFTHNLLRSRIREALKVGMPCALGSIESNRVVAAARPGG